MSCASPADTRCFDLLLRVTMFGELTVCSRRCLMQHLARQGISRFQFQEALIVARCKAPVSTLTQVKSSKPMPFCTGPLWNPSKYGGTEFEVTQREML